MTTTYDATVNLDISTESTNPEPARYHRPSVGNIPSADYWYGYFDGTDGWGALIWDHGSSHTALIKLKDGLTGYKIINVVITGDQNQDLTATKIDDTSWKLEDTGVDVESGRYTVMVKPDSGAVLKCDPIWRNR